MITGGEVSMGSQTNIILRYLRFRPGDTVANTDNGLNLYNAGTVTMINIDRLCQMEQHRLRHQQRLLHHPKLHHCRSHQSAI